MSSVPDWLRSLVPASTCSCPGGVAWPLPSSKTQCAAVATCVASRITPPQKKPSTGLPPSWFQSSTWNGNESMFETWDPPTIASALPGSAMATTTAMAAIAFKRPRIPDREASESYPRGGTAWKWLLTSAHAGFGLPLRSSSPFLPNGGDGRGLPPLQPGRTA